jgi:cephalosporin-C deacetylase-like acetyl esterase
MKNVGFEKFLQEHTASGKEKIDGCTLDYFDHMTNAERNHAFVLLSQKLQIQLLQ